MVQNAIKILTVGFFISMITGFVLYRSGYFDSEKTSYSLHSSPNGGELNAHIDQDSTKSPEINQNKEESIMPSSKFLAPAVEVDDIKPDLQKEILPSSKSMLRPIEIKPVDWKVENPHAYSSKSMTFPIDIEPQQTANQIEEKKREAFRKQPELETKDSSSAETKDSRTRDNESVSEGKNTPNDKSTPINWRGIWIGVLGILFVAIGSIVYFKQRSK